MATTFYVCRHGQTDNNKNRRLSGWIDTPLTEAGILNAKASAGKIKGVSFDKIVSSDLGRAFITAYIISRELGYTDEIERYKGLREVNYGELANLSYDDPKLAQLGDLNYVPPNGESMAHMQSRVINCLWSISTKFEGKTVLIAGHDGTIDVIRAYSIKQRFDKEDDIENAHDFVGKFVVTDNEVTAFTEIKLPQQ